MILPKFDNASSLFQVAAVGPSVNDSTAYPKKQRAPIRRFCSGIGECSLRFLAKIARPTAPPARLNHHRSQTTASACCRTRPIRSSHYCCWQQTTTPRAFWKSATTTLTLLVLVSLSAISTGSFVKAAGNSILSSTSPSRNSRTNFYDDDDGRGGTPYAPVPYRISEDYVDFEAFQQVDDDYDQVRTYTWVLFVIALFVIHEAYKNKISK